MLNPDSRERTIAVLHGELLDVIPSLAETGMDVTVFRDLLPPSAGDPIQDAVAQAGFFENTAVGVSIEVERITDTAGHRLTGGRLYETPDGRMHYLLTRGRRGEAESLWYACLTPPGRASSKRGTPPLQ